MADIIIRKGEADLAANSAVRQVTVYEQRAEVVRARDVRLARGENRVEFSNLGCGIDENTIRAKISAEEGRPQVKILSAELATDTLFFYKEAETEETFRRLIETIRKIAESEDGQMVLSLENNILGDLREYIRKSLNCIILEPVVSSARLQEALAFLETRIDANTGECLGAGAELKKTRELASLLRERLSALRAMDRKTRSGISVFIEAEADCSAEVVVQYILPGAGWRPSYDAMLDLESRKTSIAYYGEVRQNTGEDWMKARVVLSTSSAGGDISIPALYPVRLSGYARRRDKRITVALERQETLESGEGAAGAGPDDETPGAESRVSHGKSAASHSFTVKKPYDIPSDNKWHKLLIMEAGLEAECVYETQPCRMEFVYLRAGLKNTLGVPLLPGAIAIYRNSSYMGRSSLEYTAPDEPFALSFGIDDDIRVKRIVVKDLVRDAAVLSSKKTREFEYHYILYNYKAPGLAVRVREPVHRSELREIAVSIEKDTTGGFTRGDDGIVTWELGLPEGPGLEKKLVLHYTVTAPGDFDLTLI